MKPEYISNELFHFVGRKQPTDDQTNYKILKDILFKQCVSHHPHKNDWGAVSHTINWEKSLLSEELIVPTVTCYADIPEDSLDIHIKKYGKFGLSFPKQLLIKHCARPVIYIPTHGDDWGSKSGKTLLQDIEATYKSFDKLFNSRLDESRTRRVGVEPSNELELIGAIDSIFAKDFLSFIKPFNSELEQEHPHNFYMEREWRMHGNLKFEPNQVCQIYVPSGQYASAIKTEFPHFGHLVVEI